MILMKKRLICFDLDNTLIESNKAHVTAFQMAFAKNKLKKVPAKKIEAMLNGRHAHAVVKLLFPDFNNGKIDKIVSDHHVFIIKTAKYARKIGDVIKTIKEIKRHYKVAIVTNCMHKEINALLKATRLNKNLFDYIVGKEDVRHGKPYPDEILKAEHLARLKAYFMIGDSIYDIMAAKKAKVKSLSVLTGLAKRKELLKYKPDYVLGNVNELMKLLNKINDKINK